MGETYRIPKNQIPVEVQIAGRSPVALSLFLSDCAESHSGTERPSDLLNGADTFVPAIDANGGLIFLQKDRIEVVSFPTEHELGGDVLMTVALNSDQAITAGVEITLQDGTKITGTIRYLMPAGSRRLQDFLNQQDRFIALQDDKRIRLINKNRIERISIT